MNQIRQINPDISNTSFPTMGDTYPNTPLCQRCWNEDTTIALYDSMLMLKYIRTCAKHIITLFVHIRTLMDHPFMSSAMLIYQWTKAIDAAGDEKTITRNYQNKQRK